MDIIKKEIENRKVEIVNSWGKDRTNSDSLRYVLDKYNLTPKKVKLSRSYDPQVE